jgi:hypothetical protein
MTGNGRAIVSIFLSFFLLLLVIMLLSIVCAESKGQVLPRHPVIYEDGVKQLDVDAVALSLSELNRLVRYTYDNVDTLHNRVDSTQDDLDVAELDIDTLHARIDSNDTEIALLETARDSVYFAYRSDVFNVAAASTDRVPLTTEIREDGIYVHSGNTSVACNSAGYYSVDFALTVDSPAANINYAVLQKYSSGWSDIPGSLAYAEGANYKALAGCVIVQLASADSVALAVANADAGDVLPVVANTARLRIVKLH